MTITNNQGYDAAIERMIQLECQLDSVTNLETNALDEAADAYETAAGYTPGPPQALRGILEVEMFKRRMRQQGTGAVLKILTLP